MRILGSLVVVVACSQPSTEETQPPVPDTVGLFMGDGNYFALLPTNVESGADLRFQVGPGTSGLLLLPSAIRGDFDGRGGDTVGIYDQKTNEFFLHYDNSPSDHEDLRIVLDAQLAPGALSSVNPIGLAGRWSGGATDSIGIYDATTSTFQLRDSNTSGPPDTIVQFGTSGSIGLAGDWRGNHVDTIGTYDPSTGTFLLRYDNSAGPPDESFAFGPVDPANMKPVVGDWDGDGVDTVGVLDQSTYVLYLRDSNTAGPPDQTLQLERTTWRWQPLAGKWRPTTAPPATSGYAWPTATAAESHIDDAKLTSAFAYARSLAFTRSLVVVRHGKLVREDYFNGSRPEIAHDIASAAKSFLSALFGIAYGDGLIDLTAKLPDLLPATYFPTTDDPHRAITLGNLMTMTSGIIATAQMTGEHWQPFITTSKDWTTTVLGLPMSPVGTFGYSTNTVILGATILDAKVGALDEYARTRLCEPLGIRVPWWEHDPKGVMVGGGELALTARDMARFGYLYLQRGAIDGKQIIPSAWVDGSTAALVDPNLRFGRGYGLWWWHPVPGTGPGSDIYAALGFGGQYIYVIPSLDTVIAIQSRNDSEVGQYDALDTLLSLLLPALQAD